MQSWPGCGAAGRLALTGWLADSIPTVGALVGSPSPGVQIDVRPPVWFLSERPALMQNQRSVNTVRAKSFSWCALLVQVSDTLLENGPYVSAFAIGFDGLVTYRFLLALSIASRDSGWTPPKRPGLVWWDQQYPMYDHLAYQNLQDLQSPRFGSFVDSSPPINSVSKITYQYTWIFVVRPRKLSKNALNDTVWSAALELGKVVQEWIDVSREILTSYTQ